MNETIYGIHAIQAMLLRMPENIIEIYHQEGLRNQRVKEIIFEIKRLGIPAQEVKRYFLDDITAHGVHQGIAAKIKAGRNYSEGDLLDLMEAKPKAFILILDGVTDPHNLGACLRSADAAGVDCVIVPKDRSAPLNGTARKAACGAAENLPLIRVTNLVRTICKLKDKGIWVVGTAGGADTSLFDTTFPEGVALVMGAEGEGLRRLTKAHCDQLVCIPINGTVSALNVSVAAGVCLFEIVRQRKKSALL